MGLAAVVLLGACLICGAGGEWEGAAEFEAVSDIAGLVEERLDIAAELELKPSLGGLSFTLNPAFEELISDVHQVKIRDLVKAIAGVEVLIADVRGIEEGKIEEALRAEWLLELDSIWTAIEEGRLDESVASLRAFRMAAREAYETKPKRLTRKEDAKKLRSKAKTAIRNINNIEGLKEDVIDFTCVPFSASSQLDCIPAGPAEELEASLDMAKGAVERHRNKPAIGWLRDFVNRVEEGHNEGLIISDEADSLISDAEAIIGKVDKGKRERRLEIELTATIAQLELAWGLERKEPAFPAPGKDNRDTTLSFAIEADYGQLDLSLELEHQRVDFFQRWSRENSKLVDQVDLDLELDLGDLGLSKSLSYKATFFPDQIGDEVELARAALLEQAIQRLKEEIEGSPTIPSEVKSDLEGKLQSALDASDQGQRAKVIDYLLGFLDLVERRRREGKIEPAEASWLISEVWSILPRERSRILSGTTAAQFRLSSLDLDLEAEGTVKTFPAATKKDEKDTTVALGFKAERDRLSLQGSGTWGRKLFPNDPAKDEVIQAWEWTATFKSEQFKAIGSLETETTTFPHSIAKSNIVGTRSVRLEWRLFSADCTLSWERNGSGYPNAPEKDELVDQLGLVVKFPQSGFTIDLQREATAYPLAPSKDKLVRGAEFKLTRELAAGLKFELSASFVSQSYPNQPAKEEVTGEMELTITQKF